MVIILSTNRFAGRRHKAASIQTHGLYRTSPSMMIVKKEPVDFPTKGFLHFFDSIFIRVKKYLDNRSARVVFVDTVGTVQQSGLFTRQIAAGDRDWGVGCYDTIKPRETLKLSVFGTHSYIKIHQVFHSFDDLIDYQLPSCIDVRVVSAIRVRKHVFR
jgi:hypothetical protein